MSDVFSLTLKDASARTGLSVDVLRELVNARKIVAYKPGRAWLVDWASLREYIETT